MLSAPSAKAYSSWTHSHTTSKMKGKWRGDCFGAIPGRGTADALLKVLGTRQQLRQSKTSSFTFFGDGIKAFDRICRRKVLDAVHTAVDDVDLGWRHEIRHDDVQVVSVVGEATLVMDMTTGVPQGDPNGPTLYVIGNSGVSGDIDDERASKEYVGLPAMSCGPCSDRTVDLSRTTFVDDHKEIHAIKGDYLRVEDVVQQIKERVGEITRHQAKWGIHNNLDKTVLLVELHGKGSQKLRKAVGGTVTMDDGSVLKIVPQMKYLGVCIGGMDDGTSSEVTKRIASAGEAVSRLNKLWRLKGVTEMTKVSAYCQLVRTILVYGLEARCLTKAHLLRVECFQTRVLRRIGHSPSHITHESNEDLRLRLSVPSVESWLIRNRLRLLQRITTKPVDTVWAALGGKIEGNVTWGSQTHVNQIRKDLNVLNEVTEVNIQLKMLPNGRMNLSSTFLAQIKALTKGQTNKVLQFTSAAEFRGLKIAGPANEPKFVCEEQGCGSSFASHKSLQTHRMKSHAYRDKYRCLVIDNTCPMCKSTFAQKESAKNHIQKVCGTKGTEEQRDAIIRNILRERRIKGGEVPLIQAFLGL